MSNRLGARTLLLLLVVLTSTTAVLAAEWYVDGVAGNDANPGTMASPFQTIQKGIDSAAVSGDTVHVAAAAYPENLLVDAKSLVIQGAGRTTTILDGQALGSVIQVHNGADLTINSVTITNGIEGPPGVGSVGGAGVYCLDSTVTMDDCLVTENYCVNSGAGGGLGAYRSTVTITNSEYSYNTCWGGGGIYTAETDGRIENCNISHNHSEGNGGGIHNGTYGRVDILNNTISYNSTAEYRSGGGIANAAYTYCTISGNDILFNSAGMTLGGDGGGIYASFSGLTIEGNHIEGNTAGRWGGGMHGNTNYNHHLHGNTFINNQAGDMGGGFSFRGWSVHVWDNLVVGNHAPEGGGIAYGDAGGTLNNNTVVGNNATIQGAGVYRRLPADYYGPPILTNNIFWNNLVNGAEQELVNFPLTNVHHSDIGDGLFCGWNGNICVDPLFVPGDPRYRLTDSSPCRDAGTQYSPIYPISDYEGQPRLAVDGGDGLFDIGADEVWYADTDVDGVLNAADNCTVVFNPNQRDTNGDGFGNICDADLNGDLTVDLSDFSLFRGAFGTAGPDADFNGDGTVDLSDFSIFIALFGSAPGPSGLIP